MNPNDELLEGLELPEAEDTDLNLDDILKEFSQEELPEVNARECRNLTVASLVLHSKTSSVHLRVYEVNSVSTR